MNSAGSQGSVLRGGPPRAPGKGEGKLGREGQTEGVHTVHTFGASASTLELHPGTKSTSSPEGTRNVSTTNMSALGRRLGRLTFTKSLKR